VTRCPPADPRRPRARRPQHFWACLPHCRRFPWPGVAPAASLRPTREANPHAHAAAPLSSTSLAVEIAIASSFFCPASLLRGENERGRRWRNGSRPRAWVGISYSPPFVVDRCLRRVALLAAACRNWPFRACYCQGRPGYGHVHSTPRQP
jgi:hypothetical protein